MAGLATFTYLGDAPELTPDHSNYLDIYNFGTNDFPDLKANVIEKYDQTITGFTSKFSSVEELTGMKYIWSELLKRAVTYEDGAFNHSTGAFTRTTASPNNTVNFRKHEKVAIHDGTNSGVFIVTSVTSTTAVVLGTYDTDSLSVLTTASGVLAYSLGIEVGRASLGADFTTGLQQPYEVLSNRPAITREVFTEDGSAVLNKKWALWNGKPYWFIEEINETRKSFLEMIEKKHMEGVIPDSGSDAAGLDLQGTTGVFSAVRSRGGNWGGDVDSVSGLESIIKHYDKVEAAGTNLYLCSRATELAFDELGRTFNASYGGSATLTNQVGEFNNSEKGKVLDLGFKGFHHGGYEFLKQGWKYLNEYTFRGNDNILAADKINFLAVPIGMTPVSEGDQSLEFNQRKVQKNYLTIMSARGRQYDTWSEGGAWVGNRTNGDDKFKVNFLNESLINVYNAEKFLLGEGA